MHVIWFKKLPTCECYHLVHRTIKVVNGRISCAAPAQACRCRTSSALGPGNSRRWAGRSGRPAPPSPHFPAPRSSGRESWYVSILIECVHGTDWVRCMKEKHRQTSVPLSMEQYAHPMSRPSHMNLRTHTRIKQYVLQNYCVQQKSLVGRITSFPVAAHKGP